MTPLETAALSRWRERELTYPKFTRRMTPDQMDMETGAWALCVQAERLAQEAAGLLTAAPGSAIMTYLDGAGEVRVRPVSQAELYGAKENTNG